MAVSQEFAIPMNPDGSLAVDLWPNCETPDCDAKACTWADFPAFCFPCNERFGGAERMRVRWDETHDEPMEDVE